MRQRDWEKEKAIHILELVRSELYMDMPHFLTALNTLMFKEDECVGYKGEWSPDNCSGY